MPEKIARWLAVSLSYMLANLDDLEEMHKEEPLHDLVAKIPGPLEIGEITFAIKLPTGEELEAILNYVRIGYKRWADTPVKGEHKISFLSGEESKDE